MRCDEFEERWHEGLDRRVDPTADAELALHLENCAGCRSRTAALRRVLRDLEALPKAAPRNGLAGRVLAELASAAAPSEVAPSEAAAAAVVELPPQRLAVSPSRAWQWWAAAALLLVSIVPLWRWSVGNRPASPNDGGIVAVPGGAAAPMPMDHAAVSPGPLPNPTTTPEPATTEPAPTDSPPTWNDVAEGSRESARQLADNTRRSLHDAFALASLWEAKSEVKPADAEEAWYQGVAEGVAPLTDSTLGTLNVLRGLVPSDKEASL